MRPVKVTGNPPQDWLDDAAAVTQLLYQAAEITIPEAFQLQLLPGLTSINEMPANEVNMLVIGEVKARLIVRAFFEEGKQSATVEEPKKVVNGSTMHRLKSLLINNWDTTNLKDVEKQLIYELSQMLVRSEIISSIIDQNENLWRDDRIRSWLLGMFNQKCWYSEAQDTVSPIHVDHYRPKGRITDDLTETTDEGFWWLAFDWTNYKICGELLNVKKKDVFPFANGFRGNPNMPDSIDLESPILIDPRTDQTRLISYELQDEETCIAVVAGGADGTDADRAHRTIEILGLNRLSRLNQKRAEFWDKCRMAISEYKGAGGTQPLRLLKQASAKAKLKQMIKYGEEFSSVAEACINKLAPDPLRAAVFDPVND